MANAEDRQAFQQATLRTVQSFADAAQSVTSIADLESAIGEACGSLGFDHFAIVNHVDFGRLAPNAVRLSNYPERFVAKIREGGFAHDPVLRASERSSAGFMWRDIGKLITLTDRDRAYMRAAADLGLAEGFTIPCHIPGELLGSCHFAVKAPNPLPLHLAAVQSIGTFGFEAARRLLAKDDHANLFARRVPLTQRQRDCVVEVARGKSDTVIAQLLGLRPRTVNEYIETAKRRYLVATRQQLIVRALFQSDICFAEVLV